MTLDIEGVLVTHHHLDRMRGLCMNQQGAPCGWEGTGSEEWRTHVAAVLREQIAAAQAEACRCSVRARDVDVSELYDDEDAAQVACVDPSRSESGSTDPEVRQSADRTSSPSRVPGEGS